MTWFRLALCGNLRRPIRSAATAAAVAIAIATAFSLLAFQHGYQRSLWRELDRLGAHILVAPKGCPYDAASLALHGANWPCYLKASYLREVCAIPGVAVASPVLMSAFYDTSSRPTVYVGIDTNMLRLKPGWKLQGNFPKDGEILIGSEIANRLHWRVGETVDLPGLEHARGIISGLIEPTQSADDTFIFLPLNEAQHQFHHINELTHVLVRLTDPNQLDSVVMALRGCDAGMYMNVVPLAHLFRTIQSLMNSTRWFLAATTLVTLLAAGASISAAMLIAVNERISEIGVMRALGASRWDVFRVFWLEALQVCLAGAAAGEMTAFAAMRFVESWLRSQLPFTPAGELVTWEWWIVAVCFGMALVLGSVFTLLPACRAANLPPILAMRAKGVFA